MTVTVNQSTFPERVARLHVIHPRVKKIWDTLDSIRRQHSFQDDESPRHRFIIGPSGAGKTQMMRRYAKKDENKGYVYLDDEGTEYDIRPVLFVNLPDPFTIMELYQSIVHALKAPQISGRPTIGDVKRQVFTLLEKQKVEMIIFDEMDFILTSKFVKNEEAMSAIKHIANHGGVAVICVGTPEIAVLRNFDSQHIRRYPPTEIERFKVCDVEFIKLLDNIEEQIAPPHPLGLADLSTPLPSILHRASYGLVGYLTPIIQETFDLLGVFNPDFDEKTAVLNFKDKLEEAYQNIIGDVSEDEMNKVIKSEFDVNLSK
jgi:GTPase SAR1 family protein